MEFKTKDMAELSGYQRDMELVRGIGQLVNKAKENTKAYVRSEEEEKKEKAKAAAPEEVERRKKKRAELVDFRNDRMKLAKALSYPDEEDRDIRASLHQNTTKVVLFI